MVTASYNPPQFNGLKIKAHFGGAATTQMIGQIEEHLRQLLRSGAAPKTSREIPVTEDITAPFLAHCGRFIDLKTIQQSSLKVVADAIYGSSAGYLSRILQSAGTEVIEIRSERNPYFGGVNPEPVEANMQALFKAVREQQASIGISLSGDGDRLGVCDSQGRFVDSHRIFAILLKHLHTVRGGTGGVVRTVSTTHMLDKLCEKYGLPLTETPVGFKYIWRENALGRYSHRWRGNRAAWE